MTAIAVLPTRFAAEAAVDEQGESPLPDHVGLRRFVSALRHYGVADHTIVAALSFSGWRRAAGGRISRDDDTQLAVTVGGPGAPDTDCASADPLRYAHRARIDRAVAELEKYDARVVEQIHQLRRDGHSASTVAAKLNAQGTLGRDGRRWRDRSVERVCSLANLLAHAYASEAVDVPGARWQASAGNAFRR